MITDRRPTGLCSQHEPVGLYLAIAATSLRNIFDPTIIVFFYDSVVLIDHNDITGPGFRFAIASLQAASNSEVVISNTVFRLSVSAELSVGFAGVAILCHSLNFKYAIIPLRTSGECRVHLPL